MTDPRLLASSAVTVALLAVAAGIGGGVPLPPGEIASNTRSAAANAAEAADNTRAMVRDTEALATIVHNVRSQYRTSRRLYATQQRMEANARAGARRGRVLRRRLAVVSARLEGLFARLRKLKPYTDSSVGALESSKASATALDAELTRLASVFEEVLEESRELNRKARAYDRVKP